MKRVYKLAEELSDMVWHDFDKWNKKGSDPPANAWHWRAGHRGLIR